jgi:hypothetical protein
MATYAGSTEVGEFDGRGGWSAVSLIGRVHAGAT